MKNRFWLLLLSAVLVFRGTAVYADVADYQTVTQEEQKENKTIQTSRSVLSNVNSIIPVTWHMQVNIANKRPPITGAGIQNFSRKYILFFKKLPSKRTRTATATV